MEKFEIEVVDKEILKGVCWKIENPKASVVIFEGMEEYGGRYNDFALFLNENGFSVYALDVYGQGENIKKDFSNQGVWPDEAFNKMIVNFNILIEKIKKECPKVYIFSHSMGSFMGQGYIQMFPNSVEKIVLCGSGYQKAIAPLGLFVAKLVCTKKNENQKAKLLNSLMFGSFNKAIKNPKTEFDWLSYNEKNVENYIKDPKCGYGPRNKFCYEFIKGIASLYSKSSLRRINKDEKIFIITGDSDPVSGYTKQTQKIVNMYKKLGLTNVSKKIYPHMRHEILCEEKRQDVFNDVLEFFEK